MPSISFRSAVRDILTADVTLPTDEVIRRVKARGDNTPVDAIRHAVHNLRSEIKKKLGKAAPAAARETTPPKPSPAVPPPARTPASTPATSDLTAVLANVALVNRVVELCRGVENTRQVAEAVRACGGVDAFLQHVELVAGIRGSAAS